MPLDRHLAVHLQEMYATERDYQQYLQGWSDRISNQNLKSAVSQQINGINDQLDNLKQCMFQLGEFPRQDMHSPIVDALQKEDQTTMQEMPNMTPADMDVHVAMTDVAVGHNEIGLYQGMMDMADALDQSEVASLLQKNLDQEKQDAQKMEKMLPNLIQASKS